MIKQAAIVLWMGSVALMSASAFAAREERHVRSVGEYSDAGVLRDPGRDGLDHREQILAWNIHTSTLGGLRKNFDVKHDTSAIEARLESEPYLSNGHDDQNIYLRVSFNGQELSHDPQSREVVSAAQAMAGGRFPLEIRPKVPAGGYKPGTYYGNVQLIFNAVAP